MNAEETLGRLAAVEYQLRSALALVAELRTMFLVEADEAAEEEETECSHPIESQVDMTTMGRKKTLCKSCKQIF